MSTILSESEYKKLYTIDMITKLKPLDMITNRNPRIFLSRLLSVGRAAQDGDPRVPGGLGYGVLPLARGVMSHWGERDVR